MSYLLALLLVDLSIDLFLLALLFLDFGLAGDLEGEESDEIGEVCLESVVFLALVLF